MVRISPPPEIPSQAPPRTPRKRQKTSVLPSASDLWVQSLPGLDELRTTLFAGNLPSALPADDSDAHLYFLLARNKHIPNRQRLVIWFNGGPVSSLYWFYLDLIRTDTFHFGQGCSSELIIEGLFRKTSLISRFVRFAGFDGSLIEIGPYRINTDGTVREVEKGAWNEYANVLFRGFDFPSFARSFCRGKKTRSLTLQSLQSINLLEPVSPTLRRTTMYEN